MREVEPRSQLERILVSGSDGRFRPVEPEGSEGRTAEDELRDRAMMCHLHYGTGDARYDQFVNSNGIL